MKKGIMWAAVAIFASGLAFGTVFGDQVVEDVCRLPHPEATDFAGPKLSHNSAIQGAGDGAAGDGGSAGDAGAATGATGGDSGNGDGGSCSK